jgi:hypothetical protein
MCCGDQLKPQLTAVIGKAHINPFGKFFLGIISVKSIMNDGYPNQGQGVDLFDGLPAYMVAAQPGALNLPCLI